MRSGDKTVPQDHYYTIRHKKYWSTTRLYGGREMSSCDRDFSLHVTPSTRITCGKEVVRIDGFIVASTQPPHAQRRPETSLAKMGDE